MNAKERHGLEQVGKIVTFVLAVGIMGLQAWGAYQGREVNSLLIGFAVCILAPATFQLLFPFGRGGSEPSAAPPPVSSSPGPQPSSSGGSSSEQV